MVTFPQTLQQVVQANATATLPILGSRCHSRHCHCPGRFPSGHKGYGTSKYCCDLFGCFNGFESSRLRPALLDRLKASVYGSDCEVLPITATGMRITATAKWTIRQGGDRCLAERESPNLAFRDVPLYLTDGAKWLISHGYWSNTV